MWIVYTSNFLGIVNLRPHVLLEITVSDIYFSTEQCAVKTLIEDVLEGVVIFKPSFIECAAIEQTAVEKWVGLTRCISAIDRTYYSDDETLVRHIYDLNAIKQANRVGEGFFTLAGSVVKNDAKQFKNQHPEYFTNPKSEIVQSLMLLRTKKLWEKRYEAFVETMVYDSNNVASFSDAMQELEDMSSVILHSL